MAFGDHEGHEAHEDRTLKANTVAGAARFSLRVLRVLRRSQYPTGALTPLGPDILRRFHQQDTRASSLGVLASWRRVLSKSGSARGRNPSQSFFRWFERGCAALEPAQEDSWAGRAS